MEVIAVVSPTVGAVAVAVSDPLSDHLDDEQSVPSLVQAGARSLSRRLASPPIELALVEAAVRVFQRVPPAPAEPGPAAFSGAVPAAVVSFLRRRVGLRSCLWPTEAVYKVHRCRHKWICVTLSRGCEGLVLPQGSKMGTTEELLAALSRSCRLGAGGSVCRSALSFLSKAGYHA